VGGDRQLILVRLVDDGFFGLRVRIFGKTSEMVVIQILMMSISFRLCVDVRLYFGGLRNTTASFQSPEFRRSPFPGEAMGRLFLEMRGFAWAGRRGLRIAESERRSARGPMLSIVVTP